MTPVVRLPVERTLTITGTLFGREEVTLSAKVGGRVTEVLLDLGDAAPGGTPVLQIDPTDYELNIETRRASLAAALARLGLTELPPADFDIGLVPTVGRARAEEANAKARFERARELFEQTPPLIAPQEFADIRTQAEVASWSANVEVLTAGATLADARAQAAQLASAQQQLDDATVRSPSAPAVSSSPSGAAPDSMPIPYRVSERLVSLGELVSPGQAMVRLVASDVLKFRGDVPERYMGLVRAGQSARVMVEAGEPVEGVVTRVAPAIDTRTRAFTVEIEIANAGDLLKAGGFARAQIITGVDENVPHVPTAAVVTFAGVQRVFVVRDGKAVSQIVATGVARDGLVELVGAPAFTEVVAQGGASLASGQAVEITTATTPEPSASSDP